MDERKTGLYLKNIADLPSGNRKPRHRAGINQHHRCKNIFSPFIPVSFPTIAAMAREPIQFSQIGQLHPISNWSSWLS